MKLARMVLLRLSDFICQVGKQKYLFRPHMMPKSNGSHPARLVGTLASQAVCGAAPVLRPPVEGMIKFYSERCS